MMERSDDMVRLATTDIESMLSGSIVLSARRELRLPAEEAAVRYGG
jgi:hypothetical protein